MVKLLTQLFLFLCWYCGCNCVCLVINSWRWQKTSFMFNFHVLLAGNQCFKNFSKYITVCNAIQYWVFCFLWQFHIISKRSIFFIFMFSWPAESIILTVSQWSFTSVDFKCLSQTIGSNQFYFLLLDIIHILWMKWTDID